MNETIEDAMTAMVRHCYKGRFDSDPVEPALVDGRWQSLDLLRGTP